MRYPSMLCLLLALGLTSTASLAAQDQKPPKKGAQKAQEPQKVEVKPGKKQGEAWRKYQRDQARKAQEEAKRKIIEEKIRKTRARLKKEGVLQSHIQVKITLRNGEIMRGVVKNGLFVEKPTRLEFVRAEMKVPGAGIRLWYYNDTSGFIFLPYRTIKTYKILRRLTEVEVAALHDQMVAKKKVAKDEGKEAGKAVQKKADAFQEKLAKQRAKQEKKEASAAELKAMSEETRLRALLKEFPAKDGWGPEKATEIRMRFINIGVSPDARSKRFLDNLADWNKAYAKYGNEDKNKKPGPGSKPKVSTPSPQK